MKNPYPRIRARSCLFQRKSLTVALAVLLLVAPTMSFSAIPRTTTMRTTIPATTVSSDVANVSTDFNANDDETQRLRQYQTNVAAPLAASFQPSSFKPFALFSNKHLQTVVATFLRNIPEINYFYSIHNTINALLQNAQEEEESMTQFWDSRERIDTPDGDFFHVDCKLHHPTNNNKKRGMVIMCHGLESNSDSNLSRDMARAYYNTGLDVACLNFRGCCGSTNDLLGGYHLGFTDDVLLYLDVMKERRPLSPLYLSGFSLGANVILKALGELKMDAVEKYNIQGATAFCVPYDAERNAPFLGQAGFNQLVYCGNLLNTLRKRAQYQLDLHCDGDVTTDRFDYEGVMKAKTITDFDEAFVARIYGFDSAIDYYRKTSCIRFLPDIAVQTYILTARDDPFMDPTHLPLEVTQEGGGPAPIKMVGTKHGGHCGYIFHQVDSEEDILETSWSSTELARFFSHLQEQQETG